MNPDRASGILLHPTSLPGPVGSGYIGAAADFIRLLAASGQQLWQVLPLGPPGFGNSPYQSLSAFAGNPVLIDLKGNILRNLLSDDEVETALERIGSGTPEAEERNRLFRRAFQVFSAQRGHERSDYREFLKKNAFWIHDFAMFMALRDHFSPASWWSWPEPVREREDRALDDYRNKLNDDIAYHAFVQFLFFTQWQEVRKIAADNGVRIIGDVPIFVAHDSADVWATPENYLLDDQGNPTVVAGVPPDYFSPTGQRWGNPLYDWQRLQTTGFDWWIHRFKTLSRLVDIIRIDHFRGFAAYWAIPANEPTAVNGRWEPGPGKLFFEAVRSACPDMEIIAEDLGVITPDVIELRDTFGFPGMKILQFAFGDTPQNSYLPHNYTSNCVVYTGTHDNDTTVGWLRSLETPEQQHILKYIETYLGFPREEFHWALIRLAMQSVAKWAVFPCQDILGLGSEARMNTPGQSNGNWKWRLRDFNGLMEKHQHLHALTACYGRI